MLLIDHVGILVKDIDSSIPFYRDVLGLPFEGIENNDEYQVKIAMFRSGDSLIELLQPTGDGKMKRTLETKGEGFHHIAIRVSEIEEFIKYLCNNKIKMVSDFPQKGGGGSRIAFMEPEGANNVSIEFIER